MRRRAFVAAMGGALVSGETVAQPGKRARVAMLTGLAADDPATIRRLAEFRAGMAARGWREGQNLVLDVRYEQTTDARTDQAAAELLALKPDVAVAQGLPASLAMQRADKTLPVVFIGVPDPVSLKLVESLARPGGTLTGVTSTEPSFGAKWLDLMRQVSPATRRVLVMARGNVAFYKADMERAAGHLGFEISYLQFDKPAEIAPAITDFAAGGAGGLVLPTDIFTAVHRKAIIALSLEHKLPLVTGNSPYTPDGGLIFYGADFFDLYRRAAGHVDRILQGARPADLPAEQPTAFQLAINLKTARVLGLGVPPSILARADEVIE